MLSFPNDFKWGAATAAYQIEGAAAEGGKGESIWDRFSHTAGNVVDGANGDTACDHFHFREQDVRMMRDLGLRAYRFSVSWPRILPNGKGQPVSEGVDFYSRLVDALLEAGIAPALTLYHWDLPQALQDSGGWLNRDTGKYFTDYAHIVFEALGDRVRQWITLNELWVASFVGHYYGKHAPGIRDFGSAVRVSHALNLAHARAVNLFRSDFADCGQIGISLDLRPSVPETDEDHDAAIINDGYNNRWFLDPTLRGTYPADMLEFYSARGFDPGIEEGDMDLIAGAQVDFLGINYYMRQVVRRSQEPPLELETVIPDGAEVTEMGWEVHPESLYDLLVRVHRDYDGPDIYITENGMACPDAAVTDGVVHDDDRIAFLQAHFAAAWRAIEEGVKLRGYYVWSLLDNFEWGYGFTKRFGLVRTDYDTLERTVKKSGSWYRDVIGRNGLEEK